jgi:hypothetical protein
MRDSESQSCPVPLQAIDAWLGEQKHGGDRSKHIPLYTFKYTFGPLTAVSLKEDRWSIRQFIRQVGPYRLAGGLATVFLCWHYSVAEH